VLELLRVSRSTGLSTHLAFPKGHVGDRTEDFMRLGDVRVCDLQVNLGCLDVSMPQGAFQVFEICTILEAEGSTRMSQFMRTQSLWNACPLAISFQNLL